MNEPFVYSESIGITWPLDRDRLVSMAIRRRPDGRMLDQPSPRSHLAALALGMLNSWDKDPIAEFGDLRDDRDTVH